MARIPTLNETKGKTISDLEALFIVLHKVIDDKIQAKSPSGIIIAKDQPNERRIKYKEAKALLKEIESYFRIRGCFSLGICDTCASFNQSGHGNPAFGTCQYSNKMVHRIDSCINHSREGGGFGV